MNEKNKEKSLAITLVRKSGATYMPQLPCDKRKHIKYVPLVDLNTMKDIRTGESLEPNPKCTKEVCNCG